MMASKGTVNLLVIGQSPRPALESEFRARLGAETEIISIGALDGMSREEIAANPPLSGADTLFTTLPDGSSTLLSKKLVTERLVDRLETSEFDSKSVTILCCTGKFPALESAGVLMASDIVAGAISAVVSPNTKLGLFIPNEGQVENARKRWAANGIEACVVALAPDSSDETIDKAASTMAEAQPDIVLYDCISYPSSLRSRAEIKHGTKGILASSFVARTAAELLGIS
ncbi:AroM family protein [uncultured Cohaesibacter sp.]|uniref:AroM family protein n=1 Tax=uncultured Cohaesibacter sp. TaxID=1002546 RepID=UPI0029C79EBC|nr:AroM family protein [uncultured Cohaesibacter sp.]